MSSQLKQQQNWVVTASLSVLALVAIAFVLHYTQDVLIPFVVAIFIGSLVSPLMDVMELKWKWRHSVSVGVALVVVMLATALFALIMLASIRTIVSNSQQYSDQFQKFSEFVDQKIEAFVGEDAKAVPTDEPAPAESNGNHESKTGGGTEPESTARNDTAKGPSGGEEADGQSPKLTDGKSTSGAAESGADGNEEDAKPKKQSPIQQYFLDQVPGWASWLLGQTATVFSGSTLTIIFVMFVLAGRHPDMVRQGVYKDIDAQVRSYISTKVALSIGTGILVWLCLRLLSMPMAAVFGLMAFLLNFIPSVGSIISTLVPLPFAVLAFYTPGQPITAGVIVPIVAVVVLPGTVQMLIGNVLEPKLMGNDLQLHPITILLALALWGLLWGPIGMLLAVPMTAIIRIVLMKFEITRFAGEALAGKLPDLDAVAAGTSATDGVDSEPSPA